MSVRITPKLRTALLAFVVFLGMTGLGWASVPLYRVFCQVTGLNGTTQRGTAAPGAVARKLTIAFDTNVAPGMPWTFRPENYFLARDFQDANGPAARNVAGSVAEIRAYLAAGIDGFFTDDPAIGRQAIDQQSTHS